MMRPAAFSVSGSAIAALMTLMLTPQVQAQDTTGLAKALTDYYRKVNAQDIAVLTAFIPDRVLHQTAQKLGQSVPQLLSDIAGFTPDDLPEPLRFQMAIAPFDPALAEWHRVPDIDAALLPAQTTLTTADESCVTQTTIIAFSESGRWRFLDIGDAENRGELTALYPEFAGLSPQESHAECDPRKEKP